MALFVYKAYDSSGAKVDGQIEAKDQDSAIQLLKKQALLPAEIKEYQDPSKSLLGFTAKINLADLEFLTAELSLLLESGVKIDRGIDIIRKTKAKPVLAKLLNELNQSLKKGNSLSASCRQHPLVFDDLYCNLIELGEASGNLSEIFSDMAKDLKFKRDLRSKIIGSLTYPMVIFFVCMLSIVFIFNFIIPQMASMFSEAKDLPWYTQAMLNISEWMTEYQVWLVVFIFAAALLLWYGFKQPRFVLLWQRLSLRLAVIKTAIVTVERIRFNSGLSMMLKAGVPIDKALGLSAGNIKNYLLRREMDIAKQKVQRGSALTPALKQTTLYPDFFISLLEVGEESGNLSRVFEEVANRSREEFESWSSRMTTLIEPLMILFMGIFVGGIVVVMMLSMVSINDMGF